MEQTARSVPVALDEVAYMFGQFIALHIEPGLNFGSDILRNVLPNCSRVLNATTRSGSLN